MTDRDSNQTPCPSSTSGKTANSKNPSAETPGTESLAKVTDLAAFREQRQQSSGTTSRGSKLDKSESLADYYLGDGKSTEQFETRLTSIKSTLDKLNILMEKISHLEKKQNL